MSTSPATIQLTEDKSPEDGFAEQEWREEDHKNPAKAEQKRRRQIPLHDEPIGGG